MACEHSETTLHAYFDGELDAIRSAEFEQHMAGCSDCSSGLEKLWSLRAQIQNNDLYARPTAGLREKILADIGGKTSTVTPQAIPMRKQSSAATRWMLPIAAALLLSIGSWYLLQNRMAGPSTTIAAELVDAHVRSLQPGHLQDVISTDQHTVKPWFDGKLDFVPPVGDFQAEGFPLVGGRLDVLNGRNVAALVYGRRKHFINVFVWPSTESGTLPAASGSKQGYNWLLVESKGMYLCLVSDAGQGDLQELSQLITK